MKVVRKNLLVVGSTLGCYGGMEAFMITIAEAAAKWPEFEVRLCFKLVSGQSQEQNLVRNSTAACSQVFFVKSNSKQLFSLIKWADILHVQNTPPDVVFPAKLFSKKIFLTVHNWRRKDLGLHSFLWKYSVKLAYRRWFNSRFVWDTWEPGKKSLRSDAFPTVSNLPEGWHPPESRKGFLFIGRWINNKGIEEILKAYKQNSFDTEQWPLTILGDGPLRPVVEDLIKELGLTKVIMPGFVDINTKKQYLSSAKWLLAPANTREDLGLTPIEARSVGVPSIVTKDGGLPEAGGPSALVAEPGNVNDLARCMKIAVEMNDSDYLIRAKLAKSSLAEFLRPIEFYRQAYNN
ncbi:glycosyltransferase [Flavitalea sp.]|nr:glycosyltransferase [Flavitalea sp.]